MRPQRPGSSAIDDHEASDMRDHVDVRVHFRWVMGTAVLSASAVRWACTADPEPPAAGTLLVVQLAGKATLVQGTTELSA